MIRLSFREAFTMDSSEFRKRGKEMVDYIADYMENIHTKRVLPEVQPGYLRKMLPEKAPKKGEGWEDIMHDVDNCIMPGVRASTVNQISRLVTSCVFTHYKYIFTNISMFDTSEICLF